MNTHKTHSKRRSRGQERKSRRRTPGFGMAAPLQTAPVSGMKRKIDFERIHASKLQERRKQIRARAEGKPYQGFSLAQQVDSELLRRPINLSRAKVPQASLADWSNCKSVERIPGKVSGSWVFKGTRVPVEALFENLSGGATLDQFVQNFPGVGREQVDDLLGFLVGSLETG